MSDSPIFADVASRIRLDSNSYVPLYQQLKEQLQAVVRAVEPDVLVPSERELIDITGVGRATVRRAVSDLVQEGVLISRQGRGTFTAPHRVESRLERLAGFSETMLHLGRTPSTDVLEVARASASPHVARDLALQPDANVYVIERLRRIDGDPAMLERCHISTALVPDLDGHDLSGSLYEVLSQEYGVKPVGGVETVFAVNADTRVAKILDVPLGTALLATTRRTQTSNGVPIEYTTRHARGDLCSFRVGLSEDSRMASLDTDSAPLTTLP